MKRYRLFDSIAWWFAIRVAAAILTAVVVSVAFVQFAGVWAQPPIESTGLIQQVAGMVRAMDQTPFSERHQMAKRLSSPTFATQWYPRRELVPISADHDANEHDARWATLVNLLDRPDAAVLTSGPETNTANGVAPQNRYSLAIQLSDQSWVLFDTERRSWGMNGDLRTVLKVLFVLISSSIIASMASRRLTRPMQRFADAAETFGASHRAEPLQLTGPREIRAAAAAFNAMQERIQQLMDSRTEMLTAISHDLRAPLTRMRMRGEFIDDSEQQRKLFRDVDEMRAMIEASLAFFRLDAQQEEMTRLELGELIHTVADDFRDMGQSVEIASMVPTVYLGRPLALKRVLTNLIDNAVKYGGRARIRLDVQPRQVVIIIDDDGPGVPTDLIPKLFVPFFRIEASRNRATGGFGLGLPSARSIARNHGGDLIVENRQPHGMRATIILPNAIQNL